MSKLTSNRGWEQALQASMDHQGIAELVGKSGSPATGMVPTAFAGALPASDARLAALRDRRRAGEPAPTARLWVEHLLVDRWPGQAAVARYVLCAETPAGCSSFRVTDVLDGLRIVHHHAEQI